jgi:hypothetical protein
VQQRLAGRELVTVLRACPQLEGPYQHEGQGRWCVRLVEGKIHRVDPKIRKLTQQFD